MAHCRFQTLRLVLLSAVFLISNGGLPVKSKDSSEKPGICQKNEKEEWCDKTQESKYVSVHNIKDGGELGLTSEDEKSEDVSLETAIQEEPVSKETTHQKTSKTQPNSPQQELATGISDDVEVLISDENQDSEKNENQVEITADEQSADALKNEPSEGKWPELQIPLVPGVKVGHLQEVEILPGVKRTIKTLSMRPLVFEIPDFLDPLECDFIAAMAERKGMRDNPKWTNNNGVIPEDPEHTFRKWDFNRNGFIDNEDIVVLPGKMDLVFSENDAAEMFETLGMDTDGNGKIDLEEFNSTEMVKIKEYFEERLQDSQKRRNATSKTAWLWHDGDELLRYQRDVLQGFHNRLQAVTKIPSEVVEESEPIQVLHFEEGSYQHCQQDSEPFFKKVPCCLYGDMHECRICRFISLVYFLNDVEEGGELVFPLANSPHYEDDIMKKSGNWSGFFTYGKTTGSRNPFDVHITFKRDGANRVLEGTGKDEGGEFELKGSLETDEIIRFRKQYMDQTNGDLPIKYAARLKGEAQMEGRWWIPGHPKMHGDFYMHFQPYEVWTQQSLRKCNTHAYCPKTGLVVKPVKGKAIMWYNHLTSDDGRWVENLDRRTYYGLCDVTKGERWLAVNWINIIGDGNSTFKAWRRGKSWLGQDKRETYPNIYDNMAKNRSFERVDFIEDEFRKDMAENLEKPSPVPPTRYALDAISTLLNALDDKEIRLVSNRVHQKLQLMCIPLILNRDGQISLVDGSKE